MVKTIKITGRLSKDIHERAVLVEGKEPVFVGRKAVGLNKKDKGKGIKIVAA